MERKLPGGLNLDSVNLSLIRRLYQSYSERNSTRKEMFARIQRPARIARSTRIQ